MRQIESFFWGIIAALGALFIEITIFIAASSYLNPATPFSFAQLFALPQFLLLAAATEEIFKYLIIAKRVDMYSFQKSYIVNSLLVGAGFAATEFLLMANSGPMPPNNILGELAVVHLGTSGLIGYAIAIKNPKKIGTFLSAIIIATFFHASYNLLIQQRNFVENYLILSLLGLLITINLFNFLRISHTLAQE